MGNSSGLNYADAIYQEVIIANPRDLQKKLKLRFLVDTGSSVCAIPEKFAKELKLKPVLKGEAVLADGTVVPTKLAYVYMKIGDEHVFTLVVFNGFTEPLLGLDVMALLGLQADAQKKQVLKPLRFLKLRNLVFEKGWIGRERRGKLG